MVLTLAAGFGMLEVASSLKAGQPSPTEEIHFLGSIWENQDEYTIRAPSFTGSNFIWTGKLEYPAFWDTPGHYQKDHGSKSVYV